MQGTGSFDTSDVTRLLGALQEGDRSAFDRLVPVVYDELRAIAHGRMRHEAPGHTLGTTALVNEAYLKLVQQRDMNWRNRTHFFAIAAMAMRRLLAQYGEARRAAKRGGGAVPVPLDEVQLSVEERRLDQLLAIEQSLARLSEFNERGALVVQYRFFGGLTHEEIAEVMGLSTITVRRSWTAARAWLRRELGEEPPAPNDPTGA